MTLAKLPCFFTVLFSLANSMVAEDWSQFRGPNANGHALNATAPMRWSDTENVVWKTAIPGLGWSSPVVSQGRIYLTTAVPQGDGLSLRVLAIDAATGGIVWNQEVRAIEKAPSIHAKNSHASPTPILAEDSVFVHFGTLGTARLSIHDGSIQWLCTELVYPPMHGSGGSPVLCEGKLAILCDGSESPFVAALDAATGKIAWKTMRSERGPISHSFGTATIAVVEGISQVIAPGPDHLAAYDLHTGKEIWKVLAKGWSVVPQPTIFEDLIIYNHDYDNPELVAVRMGGSGDVTQTHVVWRRERGAPSTPTPVLVEEWLYLVSDKGVASCVHARTGEQRWMERLGGNYSASPVFINGLVLFLSEDGVATWVRPGPEFEAVQRNEITGKTFATPAFDGHAMFLRTDESLLKIME
jgi:outer membrane protein assembly factor BamB